MADNSAVLRSPTGVLLNDGGIGRDHAEGETLLVSLLSLKSSNTKARLHRQAEMRKGIMFNVIVGGAYANGAFNFWPDRVVEHTTDEIRERFSREGALDFTALMALPTLFMDEGIEQQLAHIGSVTAVREIGRRDLRIEYTLDLEMIARIRRYTTRW